MKTFRRSFTAGFDLGREDMSAMVFMVNDPSGKSWVRDLWIGPSHREDALAYAFHNQPQLTESFRIMSLSNPSLAAFLLDDGPRCIVVSYDRVKVNGKDQPTELKSFKSFDTSIKVGDKVVVPTDTRWGFTVGRVEVVDTRVNYSSPEQMRWIASVVDEKAYDNILAQEEVLISKVAQAQENRAKRELADELRELDPELTGLSLSGPVPDREGGAEAPARGGAQS